jgi:DNA-binding SARP family transcriptional activator
MHQPWSVRLLGGFSLQESGSSTRVLGSGRIQALVAWLACSSQTSTTRQRLAEALWPEAPDRQARNNLRTYSSHYDGLAATKRRYDPDNVFRINQNIKPH